MFEDDQEYKFFLLSIIFIVFLYLYLSLYYLFHHFLSISPINLLRVKRAFYFKTYIIFNTFNFFA